MPFLLGTDEAGYGPNLGPLVISASVWKIPAGIRGDELYERLPDVICSADPRPKCACPPVAIADSKKLYRSGKGLRLLERGLWAMWSLIGQQPATCGEVWRLLTGDHLDPRRVALCADWDALPSPRGFDPREIALLRPRLCAALSQADIQFLTLQSIAVFPREFNEALDRSDSKGAALSNWTLQLVARLIEPLGEEPIHVLCDKHGGRDRYLPLLTENFPGQFIEIIQEGRMKSVYRFGPARRRVEIAFQAKGESHLPTALASMASKYLRELAMHAFNDFWRRHVADLRPTAGYPLDARRFRAEITAAQQSLGIPDRILWREK
jgi:hypothetical protein